MFNFDHRDVASSLCNDAQGIKLSGSFLRLIDFSFLIMPPFVRGACTSLLLFESYSWAWDGRYNHKLENGPERAFRGGVMSSHLPPTHLLHAEDRGTGRVKLIMLFQMTTNKQANSKDFENCLKTNRI